MMQLLENCAVIQSNGVQLSCEVEKHSRGGWKSDFLLIVIVNGKRYTPYAMRRAGWTLSMNTHLKTLYSDLIKNMVYRTNPLLALIKKDKGPGAKYPIPTTYGKGST